MNSKRTERGAPARPVRKKSPRIKFETPPDEPPGPVEYPLTLRNLRLGLAGRLGRPLTQAQAAKLAKISRSHLANIEVGLDPASQFTLFDLKRAYRVKQEIIQAAYSGTQRRLDDLVRTRKRKSSTTQQTKDTE